MKHYLRYAVSLGTGLTGLFLLVRCTVPDRDYADLNIGNAGHGGSSGSAGNAGSAGGNGTGSSAGQGGGDGQGGGVTGRGGQDAGPTIEPIPCDSVTFDAGVSDAGSDASTSDAGSAEVACACVDGFIQAVDADGDGEGTRACGIAPGLDCDDGDGAVTHNGCGGCSALPNELGADCLDCGAYICDGPDGVVCATKPDAVVIDPDCRCLNGLIAARDTDGDGQGTRLCEENPGSDCNDGNGSFVTNACGGCETLSGTVGADCNQCGTYTCSGTALVCTPKTGSGGQQCLNSTTRQTCGGNGFWGSSTGCANACYLGNCETCIPGTFRCTEYAAGDLIQECLADAIIGPSSTGIGWSASLSCSSTQQCNVNNGTCTGSLVLPRDQNFDVVPLLQPGGLRWHDVLNTASDSDYG